MPVEHFEETIDKILKETGRKLKEDISKYITVMTDIIRTAENHNEYLYTQEEVIKKEGRFNFRDLITSVKKINRLKELRKKLKDMNTKVKKL